DINRGGPASIARVIQEAPPGIDTRAGEQRIDRIQISSAETYFGASSSSMHDHAPDAIGLGQQLAGLVHPSFADQPADARAGNKFAAPDQRLHDVQRDSRFACQPAQDVDRSFTPPAEIEVRTLD